MYPTPPKCLLCCSCLHSSTPYFYSLLVPSPYRLLRSFVLRWEHGGALKNNYLILNARYLVLNTVLSRNVYPGTGSPAWTQFDDKCVLALYFWPRFLRERALWTAVVTTRDFCTKFSVVGNSSPTQALPSRLSSVAPQVWH